MVTKSELRSAITARRATMSDAGRAHAAHELATHIRDNPRDWGATSTIAAYVPVGTEPGSVQMLHALTDLGATVLLPVVGDGPPAPLGWVRYRGPDSLRRGRFGLLTPTGVPQGADAIAEAAAIVVPALAVARDGTRLGRGAGYYDRSLAATTAELIAVVYDDEVVETIPHDHHDVAMGWALTPGDGFTRLG